MGAGGGRGGGGHPIINHPSGTSFYHFQDRSQTFWGDFSDFFFRILRFKLEKVCVQNVFFPYLKAQVYLMVHVGEKVRIIFFFHILRLKLEKFSAIFFHILRLKLERICPFFQSNIFGCKSEGILFILLLFILRLFDLFADL